MVLKGKILIFLLFTLNCFSQRVTIYTNGDSVTFGYCNSPSESYSWAYQLANFTDSKVINSGISGQSICQSVSGHYTISITPTCTANSIVISAWCINDCWKCIDTTEFKTGYQTYLNQLVTNSCSKSRTVLITWYVFDNPGFFTQAQYNVYRAIVKRLADSNGVLYWDAYQYFIDNNLTSYFCDTAHESTQGGIFIARGLKTYLASLF